MFTEFDQAMMTRALQLAQRGLYSAQPNPCVGCVITQGTECVGEGWHQQAGTAHAEINALQAAGEAARGATLYVTLEPCHHHGRTPPCTAAVIAAGVKRVVVAVSDPNPVVNGAGIAALTAAGIKVQLGLLATTAQVLNAGFFKRMQTGLPRVTVKIAASLDGRTALANGASRWITSDRARADVQHWRARSAAIMTGVGTVLADDPHLTVRLTAADSQYALPVRPPLRVVCDTQLRTPVTATLLQQPGETLIFTALDAHLVPANFAATTTVTSVPGNTEQGVDLTAVLQHLGQRGCNEVLVEAGPRLSGRLLAMQLVDEVLLYVAPTFLGHTAQPMLCLPSLDSLQQRLQYQLYEVIQLGSELRLRYRPDFTAVSRVDVSKR